MEDRERKFTRVCLTGEINNYELKKIKGLITNRKTFVSNFFIIFIFGDRLFSLAKNSRSTEDRACGVSNEKWRLQSRENKRAYETKK